MKSMLIGVALLFMNPVTTVPNRDLVSTLRRGTITLDRTQIPSGLKILSSVPYGSPVDPKVVRCMLNMCSGYGNRVHPVFGRVRLHTGLDLPAPYGTAITSTSYGVVAKVERKRNGYGNNVTIQSGEYETLYAHMSEILVKEGDYVSLGDVIGRVGSSGTSTAPHCHYEVRKRGKNNDGAFDAVNPLPFVLVDDYD